MRYFKTCFFDEYKNYLFIPAEVELGNKDLAKIKCCEYINQNIQLLRENGLHFNTPGTIVVRETDENENIIQGISFRLFLVYNQIRYDGQDVVGMFYVPGTTDMEF